MRQRISGPATAFEQGTFRDQGPKQIVFVATPSGPRIAREEMLASNAAAPPVGIDRETGVRFVIDIADRRYLVIGKAEDAWATGPARGPFSSSETQYMALRGEARWAGSEESDRPGKPMSKAQQAADVFGMSDLQLVGALKIPDGCAPLYAAGGAPPTTFPRAASVDDATRDQALAAFQALPGYQALQKEFETSDDGTGAWAKEPTVAVFGGKNRTFVSVEAHEGTGCGDWSGALWALFERKNGALVLVNDPGKSGYSPAALLDANGDGVVELIGQARLLTGGVWYVAITPGEPTVNAAVEFPFTDCGC
jgi:hypothetical protein